MLLIFNVYIFKLPVEMGVIGAFEFRAGTGGGIGARPICRASIKKYILNQIR